MTINNKGDIHVEVDDKSPVITCFVNWPNHTNNLHVHVEYVITLRRFFFIVVSVMQIYYA